MGSTRLPRFKRSTAIGPFRLTARDKEILKYVHRHRFLRSDHIVALASGSTQQVSRRLQRLFHHGYLERPKCQIDYYQSGSRRIAYGISNKGAAWLKRELALPFHKAHRKAKNHVSRIFLEHALLVSEIMVSVELACRNRTDIRLLSTEDLNLPKMRAPFQWNVEIGTRLKCCVIPDHVFGLEIDGEPCWYFLEADRATMPVLRQGLHQSSFYRKLLAYEATWVQRIHREILGIRRFRVLTVTINSDRVQSMVEACQGLKQARGLFLFGNMSTFRDKDDFLLVPWRTYREADSLRLLD